MNQSTGHSFRRLLAKDTTAYTQYVLSDARYGGLLEFFQIHIADLAGAHALDIGCGAGVVSRGLARVCKTVAGIDGNADNIALAQSYAEEAGLDNARFEAAAATRLPLADGSVDLVVLNGVLEWVGVNNAGENPQARQLQVLREAFRVLRRGGVLYLGIENRWHPKTLLRDPHSGLPIVNALPRRLADRVAQTLRGVPFQTYIYGYRAYAALLRRAGFTTIDTYVPFPGYQYHAVFVRPFPRAKAHADIAHMDVAAITEVMKNNARKVDVDYALKRLRQKASLGVLGLLAHDLSFLATKNAPEKGANRGL